MKLAVLSQGNKKKSQYWPFTISDLVETVRICCSAATYSTIQAILFFHLGSDCEFIAVRKGRRQILAAPPPDCLTGVLWILTLDFSAPPAVAPGPIRFLISAAIVMKDCSTFVAFLALVSKNGIPRESANSWENNKAQWTMENPSDLVFWNGNGGLSSLAFTGWGSPHN